MHALFLMMEFLEEFPMDILKIWSVSEASSEKPLTIRVKKLGQFSRSRGWKKILY